MTQDPGRETRLVELHGRQIVVRRLNDTQLILMMREARLLKREGVDKVRKLTAIGRIMDLFEAAVVQPEDLEYVTDLNVAGSLEIGDLMGFLSVFKPEPEKPTVVRRGRAPRRS